MIYSVSAKGSFGKDFSLRDQIRRASVSVMSNIAEGFDSGFKKEFIRFLLISKRSTSEVQCQLYIARDQEYINAGEFDKLYILAEEIRKMIACFVKYLKNNNMK